MKRIAFHETNKIFLNSYIRRTVLLSSARRTGKTTIMYQTISYLLKNGVSAKNILFISFDHPLLNMFSINEVLDIYKKNITSENNIYCFLMKFNIRLTGIVG